MTTLDQLRAGRLTGATRLDLGGGLTELPPEVFSLADTLEVLNLSGNALQTLPDELPRLHRLRVLFCSDNRFTELPPVLGRCAGLEMVAFKANRIERVDAAALPPRLRWLILTDNEITELPERLGACMRLQKLMLAGNRLQRLPRSLANCERLELVRIAANRFDSLAEALPDGLLALPRLAWLACAGNPCIDTCEAQAVATHPTRTIAWSELSLSGRLGEGASGVIHEASWQPRDGPPQTVAVKLFKGTMTSDGLPRSEMAACIAAGSHPNLVAVEGRLIGHPDAVEGLVLRLIPPGFRNLAGPPSLASCTRDVYADGTVFTTQQARRIAQGMSSALAHLHQRGLVHGDLYAHNILIDGDGDSLLGDFGAASFAPLEDMARTQALQRMDRRALAWLIDELAVRCADRHALDDQRPSLR